MSISRFDRALELTARHDAKPFPAIKAFAGNIRKMIIAILTHFKTGTLIAVTEAKPPVEEVVLFFNPRWSLYPWCVGKWNGKEYLNQYGRKFFVEPTHFVLLPPPKEEGK